MSPHWRIVAEYFPGVMFEMDRSRREICGVSWMNRAKPLIEDVVLDVKGGISRMETAAGNFSPPPLILYVSKRSVFLGSRVWEIH